MVCACDSSLGRYSVESSVWVVSDVYETGLRNESGRSRLGAERGRQRSLEKNGKLERNAEGRYMKIGRDLLEQERSERWEPDNIQRHICRLVGSFGLEAR